MHVNNNNNVTYFDSFRVEHITKEIKKFIGNKNIITNIYRMQSYVSIMCGYISIGFIDFMLKKVCWIIKIYFRVICGKYRKFKDPKISYIFEKTLLLSIICSRSGNVGQKIFKEEKSFKILKILGLIENI